MAIGARHDHFLAFWQLDGSGHVRGTEVELGTVVAEEWCVAAAFVFAQDVDLTGEVGVRFDGAGFAQHLTALDVFALGAAQQDADVVACLTLVEQLPKHFNTGAGGLLGVMDADDFDFFANFDNATLDTAGDHGTTTGDGEDVFHGHEEGTVDCTLWQGDVGVQGFCEFEDGAFTEFAFVAFHGEFGGAVDDGGLVAWEVILVQEFANFHFNEFEQFGVVHHVALVQVDDDVRHADLTSQQDVLTGLRHGAVSCGADQDGAVHLGSTSDHVFHIVSVAGAVHVSVVAVGRFVFDVSGVDGDAARFFFGCCVNLVVGLGLATKLGCQHGGDGRCQGGFAMVNVANGAHVDVGLGAREFFFSHLATI